VTFQPADAPPGFSLFPPEPSRKESLPALAEAGQSATQVSRGRRKAILEPEARPGKGQNMSRRHANPSGLQLAGGKIREFLAVIGRPGYRVDLQEGILPSQESPCHLDGKGEGVAGIFPIRELPCSLPLMVENLCDKWAAYGTSAVTGAGVRWGCRTTRPMRSWGATDDPDLFLGHSFTCSNQRFSSRSCRPLPASSCWTCTTPPPSRWLSRSSAPRCSTWPKPSRRRCGFPQGAAWFEKWSEAAPAAGASLSQSLWYNAGVCFRHRRVRGSSGDGQIRG